MYKEKQHKVRGKAITTSSIGKVASRSRMALDGQKEHELQAKAPDGCPMNFAHTTKVHVKEPAFVCPYPKSSQTGTPNMGHFPTHFQVKNTSFWTTMEPWPGN